MKINFTACEHLDFEPHYGNCKRQLIHIDGTKLCWKRPIPADDERPTLVQFCKLRGRVNSPIGCLDKAGAVCYDFNEVEHSIEVAEEEIEA